mgnify:CR=1 FL=1
MAAKKGATFGIRHPTVVPYDTRAPDEQSDASVAQGPTCYDD